MKTTLREINRGGPSPEQYWEDLRKAVLADIKSIDDNTPWQEKEPTWWLHMQKVRRELTEYSDQPQEVIPAKGEPE